MSTSRTSGLRAQCSRAAYRRLSPAPGHRLGSQERGRCPHRRLPGLARARAAHHLAEHASVGRTGLVFVGARGGVLRRNNFRRIWLRALTATGLGDVHFHDLRHTGNTLAATGGATTRELMHWMGHSRRCGPR
ncbi:tyrosine-type recombinase/integrase [Streptomyces mirabilis]|uniref:tyrosine-type recombinase/integrase n=1 Tax=Streptomyces mirabilis TaxID=68239 RepID=UPI0036DE9180